MQTVWSRAAQVQCLCKCPSCVSTTNAIARRATTITARRTVPVGNVFTVSLSSLAAGLAFADSRKKDKRRKQWDKVIAEARAAVEATDIQQQSRLAALSDEAGMEALDIDETRVVKQLREELKGELPEMQARDAESIEERDQWIPIAVNRIDTWQDVFDWTRKQRKLREIFGFQNRTGTPLIVLRSLSDAELNWLRLDGRDFRRFCGGPDCNKLVVKKISYQPHFSTTQIRTCEWSVARLVLKLLLYGSERSLQPFCPSYSLLCEVLRGEEVEARLEYARQRLRALNARRVHSHSCDEEFEYPQSPNYDRTRAGGNEQTAKLNISLKKLLEAMEQGTDLSTTMSWICYDLLTARSPPNIHTYNMLLLHFSEFDKGYLVKAVLTSMRESDIQPNLKTLTTILRFFTTRKNGTGFSVCWQRMEGLRAPKYLAYSKQGIHPAFKGRYRIVEKVQDTVINKARKNGEVYEALIIGAIRFLGAQIAMHYYRNMISEGWTPRPGIYLALLQDCCLRLDWEFGSAVLEQLESTARKMDTLTYEWMLRLCQCCGQQEMFDRLMLNGVLCGALPASMMDLPDHAKVEDVAFLIECAKDLGQLEITAARLRQNLGDKLLENIFHECEDEVGLSQRINQANSRWKVRLVLQKRLNVLSTRINHTILEGYHALFNPESIPSVSVKFWVSKRVKLLEMQLEKTVHGAATYLTKPGWKYNYWWKESHAPDRFQLLSQSWSKEPRVAYQTSEWQIDESASDSSPSIESQRVDPPPPEDGQSDLDQWSLLDLLPKENPVDGSVWESHEERMAAAY